MVYELHNNEITKVYTMDEVLMTKVVAEPEIKDGLTYRNGNSAFENCVSLKKITVPTKVKKIGSKAYYSYKKLNNLTIQSKKLTGKTIGSKAFAKTGRSAYKKLKVKVPSGKYAAYKKLLWKKGLSEKARITKK